MGKHPKRRARTISVWFTKCIQNTLMAAILIAALPGCAERPKNVLVPVAETSPSASKVEMLVATTRSPAAQPGEMFSGERGLAGIRRDYGVDPA